MNLNLTAQNPGENNRAYACRILRSSIMTLRLQPGEPLNENELAAALQMSRTPVHEALTTLQSEWLVDIYPQRGTRVSRIDPALVKEGHATRLLLESALLRDVAGKISRSEIQELLNCMRRQEQLSGPSEEIVDEIIHLDDEFHRMMYYFGGRPHTWLAMRGLVSHYDRLRYLDIMEGSCDLARVTRQHRAFCDYLLMGLPDDVQAETKVREHLTSFRGNLMDKIERYPDYFSVNEEDRRENAAKPVRSAGGR